MSNIIVYATRKDADTIRRWLNDEPDIVWIVKVGEDEGTVHWRAVEASEQIEERRYSLWHTKAAPLVIPSGRADVPAAVILDPHKGWQQQALAGGNDTPWFGADPGPYTFSFREAGRRDPAKLARSDFFWLGNRYASIGKPAHPEASRWWSRLRRFLERSARRMPWHAPSEVKRPIMAFVFPDADAQLGQGRQRELNP